MNREILTRTIDRAGKGNVDASAMLYTYLFRPIYFIGFRITNEAQLANITVSETLTTVFDSLEEIGDVETFIAFVNITARDTAIRLAVAAGIEPDIGGFEYADSELFKLGYETRATRTKEIDVTQYMIDSGWIQFKARREQRNAAPVQTAPARKKSYPGRMIAAVLAFALVVVGAATILGNPGGTVIDDGGVPLGAFTEEDPITVEKDTLTIEVGTAPDEAELIEALGVVAAPGVTDLMLVMLDEVDFDAAGEYLVMLTALDANGLPIPAIDITLIIT